MTDIQPVNQQPMSDDQELAKVLAGVSSQADEADAADAAANEPVVTTQIPTPVEAVAQDSPVVLDPAPMMPAPTEPAVVAPTPAIEPLAVPTTPEPTGNLQEIKKDAIVELRPLVDRLELAPEEKFDTYLLLLRSTDDKELIAPAHEAAKNIPDETRRAQALLDIIKEIDFLSGQTPA